MNIAELQRLFNSLREHEIPTHCYVSNAISEKLMERISQVFDSQAPMTGLPVTQLDHLPDRAFAVEYPSRTLMYIMDLSGGYICYEIQPFKADLKSWPFMEKEFDAHPRE